MKPSSRSTPASSSPQSRVLLATFGKHPAVADHMEDLGLANPTLIAFKRQFYTESLGSCIERGVWAADLPAGTPPPYDHHLLTVDAGGWIAARFTRSEDAAGRSQYPLVACLHGTEHESLLAIDRIWPVLERHLVSARAADTPARLSALHADAALEISTLNSNTAGEKRSWIGASLPDLERFVHALLPGASGARGVRVPLGSSSTARNALWWISFLGHLQPVRAITIVWRSGATFADVAPAPPQPTLFRPLFSADRRTPLVTEVPLKVAPETRKRTAVVLSTWLASPRLFPAAPASRNAAPFLEKLRRDIRGWWNS